MEDNQIKDKIRELGKNILPKDAQFILFGSHARNDAKPGSDWDILVILNKEGNINQSDFNNYSEPFFALGWELGEEVNPLLFSLSQWNKQKHSLFYHNVIKDGISLWA